MTDLEKLFTELKGFADEPEPPRRKRKAPWDKHDSIALVANNGGEGVVLEFDGVGIEYEIDAVSKRLDDLGLDDAPDGLSIWEGSVIGGWSGPFDCQDYATELDGGFRDLTDGEWELLRYTGVPWLLEDEPAALVSEPA